MCPALEANLGGVAQWPPSCVSRQAQELGAGFIGPPVVA